MSRLTMMRSFTMEIRFTVDGEESVRFLDYSEDMCRVKSREMIDNLMGVARIIQGNINFGESMDEITESVLNSPENTLNKWGIE